MPTLDVYRDWLKIADADRPLNYYQLLKLKQFEDDPAKVRGNYRQLNAHVRRFSAGEFAQQSQDLLNELAKAMLCLTDAKRKSEYDATLGRTEKITGRRRSMEEILLGRKVIEPAQLEKARKLAKTVNMDLHAAIMQQKLAPPELIMQAYAESLGIPYLDLGDITLDESLVEKIPAVMARQHSCAPVLVDDGQLLMASPHQLSPEVEDNLRLRFGMPVRSVLCTPTDINAVVAKYYPKEAAAAEMAGKKTTPTAQPAATAAKTSTAAPAQPATAPASSMSAEDRKRRALIYTGLGASWPTIAVFIGLYLSKWTIKHTMLSYLVLIAVACVGAGIGYVMGNSRK